MKEMTKLAAGVCGAVVAGIIFAITCSIIDRGMEQNGTAASITEAIGIWVIVGLMFASLTSREKQ